MVGATNSTRKPKLNHIKTGYVATWVFPGTSQLTRPQSELTVSSPSPNPQSYFFSCFITFCRTIQPVDPSHWSNLLTDLSFPQITRHPESFIQHSYLCAWGGPPSSMSAWLWFVILQRLPVIYCSLFCFVSRKAPPTPAPPFLTRQIFDDRITWPGSSSPGPSLRGRTVTKTHLSV